MIPISAQAAIVDQALKRLPMRAEQRQALIAASVTLQKLGKLREKLVASTENQSGDFDDIAGDLVDLLGLETKPVVTVYGDGKHAPVPQG